MKARLINLDYTLSDSFLTKEIVAPYFKNSRHFHQDYELVLVIEGTGKRVIGDHIEAFQNGDLVFVGPNLPHAWFNDSDYYEGIENLLARSIVTYFKKSWLEKEVVRLSRSANMVRLLENAHRGIKITGKTKALITKTLQESIHSTGLQKVIDLFTILHELAENEDYELLASINYLSSSGMNEGHRISQVYDYVLANFSAPIKLEEVATLANMSANAFCRYFKAHTEKNFSQFVNEIRIAHACKLLQQNDFPISQISYESGYQSITNFNKFFRKIMLKSPLEYRKAMTNLR